nr:MAG TPA: hypothetical protein [Caudoviricetes sp.]
MITIHLVLSVVVGMNLVLNTLLVCLSWLIIGIIIELEII